MYVALFAGLGQSSAAAIPVRVVSVQEFPVGEGVSVHLKHSLPFERGADGLYASAKAGALLAYQLLAGEGLVRGKLLVQFEVDGHVNAVGLSASLIFALALISQKWRSPPHYGTVLAATGVVGEDGQVGAVEGIDGKLTALSTALQKQGVQGVCFYPAANEPEVSAWRAVHAAPPIKLVPVACLEEALNSLGISLQRTYLGNPFRGLESFRYEHRAVYAGRDEDAAKVVKLCLHREASGIASVVVIGASGSGKSSLVQAGLLPALAEPARVVHASLRERPVPADTHMALWRPSMGFKGEASGAPDVAASVWVCWRRLTTFSNADPAIVCTWDDLLHQFDARWNRSQRFVWVIDQLEEIFSPVHGFSPARIDELVSFLEQLLARGAWVVATLRDDFQPHTTRQKRLWALFQGGDYYPSDIRLRDVQDIIRLPARASGLTFEVDSSSGRSLVHLLAEETRTSASALPLLEFTLSELYERRDGKKLTLASYDGLGGVRGSIISVAESISREGSFGGEQARDLVFARAMRLLVSVSEDDVATARWASASEVLDLPVQQFMEAMVARRLCVIRMKSGVAGYELAHEALIQGWPRLQQWLQTEHEILRSRDQLDRDRRIWEAQNYSSGLLASSPEKLAQVRRLRQAGLGMGRKLAEFVRASERQHRKQQFIRISAIATLVGLTVAAVVLWIRAAGLQQQAELRSAVLSVDRAQSLHEQGAIDEPLSLLLQASAAYRGDSVPDSFLITFEQAVEAAEKRRITRLSRDSSIFFPGDTLYAFVPEQQRLLRLNSKGDLVHFGNHTIAPKDLRIADNGLLLINFDAARAAKHKPLYSGNGLKDELQTNDLGVNLAGFVCKRIWPMQSENIASVAEGLFERFKEDLSDVPGYPGHSCIRMTPDGGMIFERPVLGTREAHREFYYLSPRAEPSDSLGDREISLPDELKPRFSDGTQLAWMDVDASGEVFAAAFKRHVYVFNRRGTIYESIPTLTPSVSGGFVQGEQLVIAEDRDGMLVLTSAHYGPLQQSYEDLKQSMQPGDVAVSARPVDLSKFVGVTATHDKLIVGDMSFSLLDQESTQGNRDVFLAFDDGSGKPSVIQDSGGPFRMFDDFESFYDVSPDDKYLLIRALDGVIVFDVMALIKSKSARLALVRVIRVANRIANDESSLSNLASSATFMRASNGILTSHEDGTVRRWAITSKSEAGNASTNDGEVLYQGTYAVKTVEQDETGKRLLISENWGLYHDRYFLYSVEAQREWHSYFVYGDDPVPATFGEDGKVYWLYGSEEYTLHGSYKIPSLGDLVPRAKAALSPRCRPTTLAAKRVEYPCIPKL